MTTYTDMIQKLDAKTSYTNYNNKPVKRINTVWNMTITTNHKPEHKTIYKKTDVDAEKEAKKFVENYRNYLTKKNASIRARYEEMNRRINGYDVEVDNFWLYGEEDIQKAQYKIESITIDITDREGNKKVITW